MRSKIEYAIKLVVAGTIILAIVNQKYVTLMASSDAGEIGLMINYLLIVSGLAAPLLFSSANLVKGASSIQRLKEYVDWTDHEKSFDLPKAPENWPSSGKLVIKDLSIRYRPGLPLVIKGLSTVIYPGEKVGIVGRTGSGKSTFILALMRILEKAEECQGFIELDGIKIESLGLHYIRKAFSIIPQEPYLL